MKLLLNIGDTAVDNDVDEGEDMIVVDDCDESQCKRKRFQTTTRVLCTHLHRSDIVCRTC